MKNKFALAIILFFAVALSACGAQKDPQGNDAGLSPEMETQTYQSERGPVEVPKNPKRIVALTYAPNVLALGGELVGVDQWSKNNPLFSERLKEIDVVSDTDLERIIALNPDLIIAGAEMKNTEEMSKIAPTVVFTWGKKDFLAQHAEIGKLLNKEEEAREWIAAFQRRAEAAGQEIKNRLGEQLTVSVFETDGKNFFVFGDKWARGTELLYQAMRLQMPEKVKEDAVGPGYYTISEEILPEYAGDYIVLSRDFDRDASFTDSRLWNEIPAVKNDRVIEIDTKASTYSDPITLEYLLNVFEESFLGR